MENYIPIVSFREDNNEFEIKRILRKSVRIFHPFTQNGPEGEHRIISIEFNAEYTRIDYHYVSRLRGNNKCWINIHDCCHLRPRGMDTLGDMREYKLIRAENIPIAPKEQIFSTVGEDFYYTLYFEPIPWNYKCIDVVEMENEGEYINFYRVILSKPSRSMVSDHSRN